MIYSEIYGSLTEVQLNELNLEKVNLLNISELLLITSNKILLCQFLSRIYFLLILF